LSRLGGLPGAAAFKTAEDFAEALASQRVPRFDESRVALCLARAIESEPARAKIVAAWPILPEPIRRAIMALIGGELG
jgi:hypothetical protein